MSLVRFRPEAPSEQSPGEVFLSRQHASVAHLVERHLAKVEVASSSLVTRSNFLEQFCSRWCHSQVVRQSSAKAPLPSSNLGGTSKKKHQPFGWCFFLHSGNFKMLGRNKFALIQVFGRRPKRSYGAKAPPYCVGADFVRYLKYSDNPKRSTCKAGASFTEGMEKKENLQKGQALVSLNCECLLCRRSMALSRYMG